MAKILPMQGELCQPLPNIIGNADYLEYRHIIMRINELIELSGLDQNAMIIFLNRIELLLPEDKSLNPFQQTRIQFMARKAFRCMIAKELTGLSFRSLSARLADSPLLQDFCYLTQFGKVQVPGKSTLERWEKAFCEDEIREMVTRLLLTASAPKKPGEDNQELMLEKEINLADYYLDTTCIKANIHYPVDWILLRDATRTLMKATILIRNRGLKKRMENPRSFVREMNKLCIRMTHARNEKDSKRKRKRILRMMKKMMAKVKDHALRHRDLLAEKWQETDLTRRQAFQILNRMDNVISKLPEALRQAHERIIGERKVKNAEKILSLYDRDINVVVRKKADAMVEFGNKCLIGEQEDGLIIDWMLYKGKVPGDAPLLSESLNRIERTYNMTPDSVATDRGFSSKKNQELLKNEKIKDFICPKSVRELKARMKSRKFVKHQERRAQTEARIAIIKNVFLGKLLRSKGFRNRNTGLGWAILTHNLWVMARLPCAVETQNIKKPA
jgi:IS5 family transposase